MSAHPFPWPTSPAGVTAESLAKHYAATYQLNYAALDELPLTSRQWEAAISNMCNAYVACYLLRHLAEHYPAVGNHWARELVTHMNAAEVIGENVWEWLTEWGIDVGQITAAGKAMAAEIKARDAR